MPLEFVNMETTSALTTTTGRRRRSLAETTGAASPTPVPDQKNHAQSGQRNRQSGKRDTSDLQGQGR